MVESEELEIMLVLVAKYPFHCLNRTLLLKSVVEQQSIPILVSNFKGNST